MIEYTKTKLSTMVTASSVMWEKVSKAKPGHIYTLFYDYSIFNVNETKHLSIAKLLFDTQTYQK